MELPTPLAETLDALLPVLEAQARYDWWIIGSAACALHGSDPGTINDLDVLLERSDMAAVIAALGVEVAVGEGTALFRSDCFVSWGGTALPVELMTGFYLKEGANWVEICPASRVAIEACGTRVFVPERAELYQLLMRFGRDKDLARAAALSASAPFPSRSDSA